jgi:hypothetical protein
MSLRQARKAVRAAGDASRRPAAAKRDVEAAHGWVVARCVDYWLWGLERGLTIDPVRCERILNALIPHS